MSFSVDTDSGRYYPWKGSKFVSVTTGIGQGIPKPRIEAWKYRSLAEAAAKMRLALAEMTFAEAKDWLMKNGLPENSGAAADLGSSVHDILDKKVKGKKNNPHTTLEGSFVLSFDKFVKRYQPRFIETECTVFSRTHGYAGKVDFFAEIEGKVYVGDYKTGKAVWPESALQVTAYKNADFIGRADGITEDPLPICDGGVILHLRPMGYKVYEVDTSPQTYDTFLSALDIFRWLHVDSERVIGRQW